MPTALVRHHVTRGTRRAKSTGGTKRPALAELAADEIALNNAVGSAAARDLAARRDAADAEDAALVNAVARAAARSLAS